VSNSSTAAGSGIGFGCALAIAISWSQHQSIVWAIIRHLFVVVRSLLRRHAMIDASFMQSLA
jgi:hypothetical protein